jgi:tetratricopeptide (TPR) repeat protein
MRPFLSVCLLYLLSGNCLAQDGKVPITTSSEEARSLYLQGRVFVERLQAREGRALFERAVARDPDFALAEYNLALAAPNAREASAHLERALARASRVSPGERLLILAQQARVNADPAQVVRHLEALVAQYPQDERGHWLLGSAYGIGQRYAEAIAEYRKAIVINPGFSLAYNSIGYAYRAIDSMAEAEQAFQRYIALVPDDPNPYDSYAELLMKLGRFDASIVQYRKALAIDPNFGASHVGIAANHMFAGRYPDAIAEAQVYYDQGRDDRDRRIALSSQVFTYVEQGRTQEALGTIDKAYRLAQSSGDTANMAADGVTAADILLEAGQVEAARERYQQAHDLIAASSLPAAVKQDDALSRHYNMGRVALALHDLPTARREAAAYLSGAVERRNDVRVRQAHEFVGLLDLHDQKYDASLTEFDQGNDRNPEVLHAVAQIWRGKGDLELAARREAQAVNAYNLPTQPYVFIRAKAKRSPGT